MTISKGGGEKTIEQSTTQKDLEDRLATLTPRVTVMLQSLETTEYLPPLATLNTLSHTHTHIYIQL